MNKFQEICNLLLKNYGFQGWWPVTSFGESIPEYSGGPINEKQKFEVIIGAILTQNTSWKNVEKAIVNLNKKDLIDAKKILNSRNLANLIRPAGYFNQKAERLKIISKFILENPVAKMESMKISELRQILLGINGIGPETADSIILYAFGKPIFVIDAYTRRIFSRLGFLEEEDSYEEWQELFHQNLRADAKLFNEFHALIVEHAKQFCKKKPECSNCFLNRECKHHIKSFI